MRLFAKIGVSLALLVLGVRLGWAQQAFRLVEPNNRGTSVQTSAAVPTTTPPAASDLEPILHEPELIPPANASASQQAQPFSMPAAPPAPTAKVNTQVPAPIAGEDSRPNDENTSIIPFSDELGLSERCMVVRFQAPPPLDPFGGAGPPPVPGPVFGPAANPLDCGVPGDKKGNFWDRCCQQWKDCCKDMFQSDPDRKAFMSDHCFDMFTSPVSNPFFFLDPRSLTEVKPLFIYQHTPSSNSVFAGGSNYFIGLQGSLAITDRFSFRITELGVSIMDPNNPNNVPSYSSSAGISELHFGPQFTIIHNKDTKTLLAAGLTFEIPWGSQSVYQHTGSVGVVPYISFGQNFLSDQRWGSFNFLNTTGFTTGGHRSDFFFSSFHLDYNYKNLNRFFPLIELNWAHYFNSGNQNDLGFEGWDLYNFGNGGVSGSNAVTLNLGGRVQINDSWSVGLTGGFGLTGGSSQLDNFRLTVDMIFRY